MFIFDQNVRVSDGSIGTIASIYKSFFNKEDFQKYEFAIKGNYFYILLVGREYSSKNIYGNIKTKCEKKVLLRKPLKK